MKRSILLAVSALTLIGACKKAPVAVEAPVAPGSPEFCAVADAYLKDRLGRLADKRTVVVTRAAPVTDALNGVTAEAFVHPYDPSEAQPYGWPKDPPSLELAQAWLAGPKSNVLAACSGLEASVTSAGVEIVSADERPRRGDQRLRLAIALPMVSSDGTEALLLEVGRVPKAGGGDAVSHLRKGLDGAWQETGARTYVPGFQMPDIPDVPPEVGPPPAKKK